MRSSSALRKTILLKFLLISFQKSMNTYANPGALFMEIYLPTDSLLHPSTRLLILNYNYENQKSNESISNLRHPAPIYESYKSLSCNSIIF